MIGNDEANQRNANFDSDINQSVTNFSIAAILKSSFGQKRLGSIVSSDFPSRHATKSDTRLDTPPSWSASSLTDIPFVHCGKNGQVFQQLKDRLNDAKAVQSSDVFRRDEVSYSVSNSSISQTDIQSKRRLSSASRATSPVDLSMNDRQCYLSHPHNFVEEYVPFTQNSIHSHIIQSLFGSGKCLYYPTDPILTAPLHDRSVGNVEGNVPTPIHHIGQNYAHGDQSIDGAKISTKNFNLDRLSSIRRHQFWLEKPTFFGLSSLLPLYMNTTSKSFVRDVVANGYGTNTEIRSRLKLRSAAVRDVANRTRCEKPKISGNERCTNGEVEKDVCVAPHSRKGVNVNCVSEVASTASKTNSHVLDGMQTVSEDKERQLPAWVFCTRYSDRPSSGWISFSGIHDIHPYVSFSVYCNNLMCKLINKPFMS